MNYKGASQVDDRNICLQKLYTYILNYVMILESKKDICDDMNCNDKCTNIHDRGLGYGF